MPVFYFDTSGLLKRYKPEPGTDFIDSVFQDRRSDEVFVSSAYVILETISTARRLLRGRELRERAYWRLVAGFFADLSEHFALQPITTEVLDQATMLAQQEVLRPGDAIHLATFTLASQAHAPLSGVLISSDRRLREAAVNRRCEVIDPVLDDSLDRLSRIRRE